MLITHIQELTDIYPTSLWTKIDRIMPVFSRIENTYLRKFLGKDLLNLLNKKYSDLAGEKGISHFNLSPDIDTEKNVLLSAQQVIVFKTLADNVHMLATSLNRGGGFNRASSGSFDDLDDKELSALSREMFLSSQQALEALILFLEEDAKSEAPVFKDEWSKSEYFYLHSELFFPTADSLEDYYHIESKRTTYNQLLPNLRSVQLLNLQSKLGVNLTRMLLSILNSAPSLNPSLVSTSPASDASPSVPAPDAPQPSASLVSPPHPVLIELIEYSRHALAHYLKASLTTKPSEVQLYTAQGDQHVTIGIRPMLDDIETFRPIIEQNPPLLYAYTQLHGALPSSADDKTKESSCSCECSRKRRASSGSILDLTS